MIRRFLFNLFDSSSYLSHYSSLSNHLSPHPSSSPIPPAIYITSTILTDPYYQGYELLFTGHSLGGGVAQIVASRLKCVAVVFSAPGVVLSRRKFKISLDDIDAFNVNVWAVGDLVPLIDQQSIKAQTIRCSPERMSYHCHSILHTIDEIEGSCGDGGEGREGGREGGKEMEGGFKA